MKTWSASLIARHASLSPGSPGAGENIAEYNAAADTNTSVGDRIASLEIERAYMGLVRLVIHDNNVSRSLWLSVSTVSTICCSCVCVRIGSLSSLGNLPI